MNEAKLFDFLQNIYLDLCPSSDMFSPYDCFTESSNLYIELKCRKTHYDDLLIEQVKYDRLRKEARGRGMLPIYICSTPKGIWGWNLAQTRIEWESRELPTTTEFEDKSTKQKIVGYLKISQGKKLD